MISLFSIFLTYQAPAQMKSNLYQKPEAPAAAAKQEKTKTSLTGPEHSASGNLPAYLVARHAVAIEESPVILPPGKQSILNANLNIGEVVFAEIRESLIAFSEAKAPVRAIIKNGKLKGAILLGEATLEKNSKRILISFLKLRSLNSNQVWQLSANALDSKGILGIEGQLISGESRYFAAELLAAGAAGYADATIERSQNAFGNPVEAPTADTFSKKALSSALSKSSDRFAEKLKSAPEYSVLEGPFEIQILVTETPTLTN